MPECAPVLGVVYSGDEVPVIDLRDSDEEIVPTLRNACTDVGFFYVVGHGVCVCV
jgi:isopenicillin N synthase-like dioxygenase